MGFIEILNNKKKYGLKMTEKSEKKDTNLKVGRIDKAHNKIIYVLFIKLYRIFLNAQSYLKIKNTF